MAYTLNTEAAQKLRSLVEEAQTALREPLAGTEKLIGDIYAGRDPLGGAARLILGEGIPLDQLNIDPDSTRTWRPPETTANLFLSRIRQIVTALTPGVPSIAVESRVPGASRMAEYQEEITAWAAEHGNLEESMRRCAFLGLLSPYVGCKLVYDADAEHPYERLSFIPVEPGDCGYEPFHRRFSWHTYQKQWSDLPKSWRPDTGGAAPNAWDIVSVTEVYHEGFRHGSRKIGKYPMSIFVELGGDESKSNNRRAEPSIGQYVYSDNLPETPLRIVSYLDPAPREDIPPAEVLSWIPLMRMIVQVLIQINREITTVNKVVLYDKAAISDDVIATVQQAVPGATIFAPVDVDDSVRGINATMRPVEQASVLGEYLASLQTYLTLFDDVTGVGPLDRGAATNPRKSATEASSIVAASNRRNRDRLEVLAGLWSDMARVQHSYQQLAYGDAIEIPLPGGMSRTIPVPDPIVANYGFRVDPVEMGHLTRRGEVDTYFNWLTTVTNVMGTFKSAMPRMVRESLRRLGKAMGVEDVDLYLETPVLEEGPQDRYIEHLQTGRPIPVQPTDQHELYIDYYGRMLDRAVELGAGGASVGALTRTIDKHKALAARAQANMSPGLQTAPVPGVGSQGQVDNQIEAAVLAGLPPPATEQTLG